ncbi:6-bladed beta-propeller [Candidatus Palauibacter sp.]|uniref:6-bladed beta-propeller n=1 Tax=Candidatus Palauibacter sp. TaxID=3101350 RepID=UPI003B51D46D
MPLRRAVAVALGSLCTATYALGAQEVGVTWIPDDVACPACTVELTERVRLGDGEGPGAIDFLGGHSFSAVDSRGRIYLREHFSTEIKVYEADGAFRRTIGREGEGPGEFRGINGIVVGSADSLFVLDRFSMRMSVFSPDHELVRSAPLKIRPQGVDPIAVAWNPGHFYMISHMEGVPGLAGWPIHQIDARGRRVHSLGSETGEVPPSEPYDDISVISDGGDGTLWVGRLAHYWIQRRSPASREPIEEIRREPDWFPEPSEAELRSGAHGVGRPPPLMSDILEDDGLLWVLTWLIDPNWTRASPELEDDPLRYDSMIEVIDLEAKRVVARARFDELYDHYLGPGLVGGPHYMGGYVPVFRIMNMKIIGR